MQKTGQILDATPIVEKLIEIDNLITEYIHSKEYSKACFRNQYLKLCEEFAKITASYADASVARRNTGNVIPFEPDM